MLKSVKGCHQTDPPNGAMKSWVWEHLGNFGLNARPSAQVQQFLVVNISAAKFIFACANHWVGVENRSKFIVLQIVPHFGHQKNVFFAFPHVTCVVFFRAPNCFFFRHFMHQIVLFFDFFRYINAFSLQFFVRQIVPKIATVTEDAKITKIMITDVNVN